MSISKLQNKLDHNYDQTQGKWEDSLKNLDMTGNFTIADAEDFFKLTSIKSTQSWAVSQELAVNHEAQKKIIDSL